MYRVVYLPFPDDIYGVVKLCDDGSYLIAINQFLSEDQKAQALQHELTHIQKRHFFDFDSKNVLEIEADT